MVVFFVKKDAKIGHYYLLDTLYFQKLIILELIFTTFLPQ